MFWESSNDIIVFAEAALCFIEVLVEEIVPTNTVRVNTIRVRVNTIRTFPKQKPLVDGTFRDTLNEPLPTTQGFLYET